MPFHLIHATLSRDLIDAAKDLLALCEQGEAVGFSVHVMLKGRRYVVDAIGESANDPVLARGQVRDLLHLLDGLAQELEADD